MSVKSFDWQKNVEDVQCSGGRGLKLEEEKVSDTVKVFLFSLARALAFFHH